MPPVNQVGTVMGEPIVKLVDRGTVDLIQEYLLGQRTTDVDLNRQAITLFESSPAFINRRA
jgi:hypothetical protein